MTSSEAVSSEATVFHQKQFISRFQDSSVAFWSENYRALAED